MKQTTKDFIEQGGMIFHVHEKSRWYKRVITIAYVWTDDILPETRVIIYGATIHRQDDKADSWYRKEHNKTAIARCNNYGIAVDPGKRTGKELHTFLRNCLFKFGCREDNTPDIIPDKHHWNNCTITSLIL